MRNMPSVKEFVVWREYYDLVGEMRAEMKEQTHASKRRCSIYKVLRKTSWPGLVGREREKEKERRDSN